MNNYKRSSMYIHFDSQDQDIVLPWISALYDHGWNVIDSGQGVHIETRKLLTECDIVVLVISKNIYTQDVQSKPEFQGFVKATSLVREKVVLILVDEAKIPEGFSNNGVFVCQHKDIASTVYFLERSSVQILQNKVNDLGDSIKRLDKGEVVESIRNNLHDMQKKVDHLLVHVENNEKQIEQNSRNIYKLQEKFEGVRENYFGRTETKNLVDQIKSLEHSLDGVKRDIYALTRDVDERIIYAKPEVQRPVQKETKTSPDSSEVLREIHNLLKQRQVNVASLIAESEKLESVANEYSKKTAKLQKQLMQMEDYYEALNDKIATSDRKIKELRWEIVSGEVGLKQVQFAVSVAFPKRFSKGGQSSKVYVHLYLPRLRKIVEKAIQIEMEKKGVDEKKLSPTQKLAINQLVQISLTSHDVDFGEAKKIRLENSTRVEFNARPKELCTDGIKWVMLDIKNAETDELLVSETFEVRVYDVLIGFIPRPLANQVSSAVLAIGSSVMLFLTFVGKVDDAFGFTSGATAWAISAFVLARLINLYQSQGKTHNVQ